MKITTPATIGKHPDCHWPEMALLRFCIIKLLELLEFSDPGVGSRIVALERQETDVVIWSELDRDRLLDLAASLAPATEAPRL